MKRQYTHIKIMEPEIIAMREQGKTRQEIADALGLTKVQIKNWVRRYNKEPEFFISKKQGRPRTSPFTKQREMELRIKELEREVDLYRSFLQAAGRV
ncbi:MULTISPECIES: helix-turn-helix domain-containing protein [Sporomusa]|uniref:helix-turn-helix domain-containing protein n=1 Tax=Sporomusa TaxID=2375 RepID=UPI001667CDEF|nr:MULTISPECIES: helix-turn-helix domain-containing protein [Sporomusa]MCM0758697.1 helix-turn-helix domain-containing protein [Sporomusa sphaeroides DSM 2875]